jgi:hypothetical protein
MRFYKIKTKISRPSQARSAFLHAFSLVVILFASFGLALSSLAAEDESSFHNERLSLSMILSDQFHPTNEQLQRRPLLYFRVWANKPLPPVKSFLFLVFITLVASELMPKRMAIARRAYATAYWKCLWHGIVACLLFLTAARALYFSEIGIPLALVDIGVLEFFLLIGFAVSSTLIGQTLLLMMRLKRTAASGTHWSERFVAPVLGCLVLSLLLIIPPLGILPRIGVRLIMLLCFLGMGAFFRTGMGTKELGISSEM